MKQSIEELIAGHRDAITVKRVFGDPFQQNGITVIPAASIAGGGGGGEGSSPGEGSTTTGRGSGFGLAGRPAGAFIIRGDEVTWMPALDHNRIITGMLALAALAILVGGRRRRK